MLGIAREEQSNPVELKFFRGTTGANVVADATPDADRTLRLRSTVPHFSQYPYIGLGHSYNRVHYCALYDMPFDVETVKPGLEGKRYRLSVFADRSTRR